MASPPRNPNGQDGQYENKYASSASRRTRTRIDRDGVKIRDEQGVRKSVWLFAAAASCAAAALLFLLGRGFDAPEPPLEAAATRAEAPPAVSAAIARRGTPVRIAEKPEPAPSSAAEPAVPDSEPEPDFSFGPPGSEPSGIALFPPPGTDPPKRGIIVPEDFELPTGYVRHYQATDAGEELAAILMFHPDFEWLDENGEAIAIPENRVVPPELAPPGLAIEMLELPESGTDAQP